MDKMSRYNFLLLKNGGAGMTKRMTGVSRGAVSFLMSLLLSVCLISIASSAQNVLGLDTGTAYDIYIGSGSDDLSVIKDVVITDLRNIGGVVFLVIQTDSFEGKRSEGLVLLNNIRAVLPSSRMRTLQGARQIKTN